MADPAVLSFPYDPSAVFEAGQIASIIEINGEMFVTVSDGKSPIGIIDDNKTSAFSGTVASEVIIVPAPSQVVSGVLKSSMDVMGGLQETNIIESSFSSNFDLILNPKKGTFVIPAGTPLNYDDGQVMGFEVVVAYRYTIVDYPGDSTVDGSGKISIHFKRGIFVTNIFDTLSTYYPNCPLYCNSEGILTSQPMPDAPVIAIAMQPASAINNELMFMWL
jgi:hypothetical protein